MEQQRIIAFCRLQKIKEEEESDEAKKVFALVFATGPSPSSGLWKLKSFS